MCSTCNCKASVQERMPAKKKKIHKTIKFADGKTFLQRTITAVDKKVEMTESTMFFNKHSLTLIHDSQKRTYLVELDDKSVLVDDNFWRKHQSRTAFMQVRRHYKKEKLEKELLRIATSSYEPSIISFLLQFSNLINLDLENSIIDHLQAGFDNTDLLRDGTTFSVSSNVGCYESGFCSAEFSSCEECYEDIVVWGDEPEGGGSGGGTNPTCVERWLSDVLWCTRYKDQFCSACERLRRIRRLPGGKKGQSHHNQPNKPSSFFLIDVPVFVDEEGKDDSQWIFDAMLCQMCDDEYQRCIETAENTYQQCINSPY